jgi:hypothetical protein
MASTGKLRPDFKVKPELKAKTLKELGKSFTANRKTVTEKTKKLASKVGVKTFKKTRKPNKSHVIAKNDKFKPGRLWREKAPAPVKETKAKVVGDPVMAAAKAIMGMGRAGGPLLASMVKAVCEEGDHAAKFTKHGNS